MYYLYLELTTFGLFKFFTKRCQIWWRHNLLCPLNKIQNDEVIVMFLSSENEFYFVKELWKLVKYFSNLIWYYGSLGYVVCVLISTCLQMIKVFLKIIYEKKSFYFFLNFCKSNICNLQCIGRSFFSGARSDHYLLSQNWARSYHYLFARKMSQIRSWSRSDHSQSF